MKTKEPCCYARQHMTLEEYGLWKHAREVAHDSGIFYMDGRTVAGRFSHTGKNTIYRVAKQLEKKGWFLLLKRSRRLKSGIWAAKQYKPLSHEEWAEKHPKKCTCPEIRTGSPVPETGLVDSPVPESGQATAPVPKSNLTCPEIRFHLSRNRDIVLKVLY